MRHETSLGWIQARVHSYTQDKIKYILQLYVLYFDLQEERILQLQSLCWSAPKVLNQSAISLAIEFDLFVFIYVLPLSPYQYKIRQSDILNVHAALSV